MIRFRPASYGIVLSLGMLVLSGCGGEDLKRPALGKVSGSVEYKGQPVKEGQITFYPENGRSATGKVIDGKIEEVTTFDPNDGAPVGSLKVTVVAFDKSTADAYNPGKNLLPTKYASLQSTPLSVEIKPGANDVGALKLAD